MVGSADEEDEEEENSGRGAEDEDESELDELLRDLAISDEEIAVEEDDEESEIDENSDVEANGDRSSLASAIVACVTCTSHGLPRMC